MLDTIEWLETIGQNASLRHAPAEQLVSTLDQAGASAALKAAAMSGDKSKLSSEWGGGGDGGTGGGEGPFGVDHSSHSAWIDND
ncbi:hypothetical protein [Dyella acidiphila]|uniref:Uncharacterized protein n=1 Tax=Dyella acidiphila TaxID=2775866 RepID=A0ABR9GER2_9GAMM|nr:hypothetical protein [Dyella acidiphila]MBE1162537.1 hypothetical protein [Dyella acidiphila]